jgi:hypothetical protein
LKANDLRAFHNRRDNVVNGAFQIGVGIRSRAHLNESDLYRCALLGTGHDAPTASRLGDTQRPRERRSLGQSFFRLPCDLDYFKC